MSSENGNGGELKPAGRFERIERALDRIESKLDTKAEQTEVDRLTTRLDLVDRKVVESMAMGMPLIEQFKTVVVDVEQLKQTGSPDARTALEMAQRGDQRLHVLEKRAAVEDAVDEVKKDMNVNRRWLIALVVASGATLCAGVLGLAVSAFHWHP